MTAALRRPLAALAALALCAATVSACGGGDDEPTPRELLAQTFGAGVEATDNGRVDAAFRLDPEGLLALGGPVRLDARGPFDVTGGGLPRFDLDVAATLGGQRFRGGALSTGERAYVRLGARPYRLDEATLDALRGALRGGGGRGLAALGLDPLRWLGDAERKGTERVGGAETVRIGADVRVGPLLADLDRLLARGGGSDGLLGAPLRAQLAEAVDRATADVWTGSRDRIMRQLAVRIEFAFDKGRSSPVPGLDAGRIALRVRLDDVNRTKLEVTAPRGARPLEEVLGGGLAEALEGLAASLTGSGAGLAGGELIRCLNEAAGDSERLVRCLARLAR